MVRKTDMGRLPILKNIFEGQWKNNAKHGNGFYFINKDKYEVSGKTMQ